MALELAAMELREGEAATIVGDNLAVVRYGAATGRLLRPELHAILDQPLGAAACTGRVARWMAVRRCYNAGADAAAGDGCNAAAAAAAAGRPQAYCDLRRH